MLCLTDKPARARTDQRTQTQTFVNASPVQSPRFMLKGRVSGSAGERTGFWCLSPQGPLSLPPLSAVSCVPPGPGTPFPELPFRPREREAQRQLLPLAKQWGELRGRRHSHRLGVVLLVIKASLLHGPLRNQ